MTPKVFSFSDQKFPILPKIKPSTLFKIKVGNICVSKTKQRKLTSLRAKFEPQNQSTSFTKLLNPKANEDLWEDDGLGDSTVCQSDFKNTPVSFYKKPPKFTSRTSAQTNCLRKTFFSKVKRRG